MKTLSSALFRSSFLLAAFFSVQMASGFYDPTMQRWINRDPSGEEGGLNLYVMVGNRSTGAVDPWGLAAWVCTKPAFGGLPGRHAFLWRDDTEAPCSMQGISSIGRTFSPSEVGSGPTAGEEVSDWYGDRGLNCKKVPGSDGNEKKLFECCQKEANRSPFWFPGLLDCHTPIKWCLKLNDMIDPGHSRF